jgi:hypothetical protein
LSGAQPISDAARVSTSMAITTTATIRLVFELTRPPAGAG